MYIIPTLNLRDFVSGGSKKESFVTQLKHALETKGFFFLKNHGISVKTISSARTMFNTFFNFPEEVRKKYEYAEEQHQRGYTPLKTENFHTIFTSDFLF